MKTFLFFDMLDLIILTFFLFGALVGSGLEWYFYVPIYFVLYVSARWSIDKFVLVKEKEQ